MGDKTGIEWTDHTWNPWRGCRHVSPGCDQCYMFRDQRKYGRDPEVIVRSKTTFDDPLKWDVPAKVFTCSWSDWFIQDADPWREYAWAIIRATPHLTYQILTKRPKLIADRLPADWGDGYPNVWLGVSVESQEFAQRVDAIAKIPAAVRFVSCEPLLGPLNLRPCLPLPGPRCGCREAGCPHQPIDTRYLKDWAALDWVIAGGESGPGARPVHPDWVRSIRDQCAEAGVPFFFKQWGEWAARSPRTMPPGFPYQHVPKDGEPYVLGQTWAPLQTMYRVGKKAAGAVLDGREHREMP